MVQFTHTFELVRGASSSSLKGNLAGKSPRLNSLVIQGIATPVISPASSGATFRTPPGVSLEVGMASGASESGKVYRIEVTGYRASTVNNISKFRRSNQVYLVPYEKLSRRISAHPPSGWGDCQHYGSRLDLLRYSCSAWAEHE